MTTSLLEGAGTSAPEATTTETPTTTTSTQPPAIPDFMKDWKLEPEIAREEALLNFKNPEDLVKSYVHAKKFVGADKIKVPNQHTTDEEWKQIYSKLGLPETADKYNFDMPKELNIDQKFLDKFKSNAHAYGILPQQATKLVQFYNDEIAENIKTMEAERDVALEKNKNELKEAWGEAFEAKAAKARFAIEEMGGKEMYEHLTKTGMLSDAKTLMMLSKMGEALSGDSLPGIKQTSGGAMTPEQAEMKLDEIREQMIKINDSSSPKYLALQKEQAAYAKYAYPTQMGIFPPDGE